MEKVHFHQEQMLPELKEFVQKGIFTQSEIKQIIKKRTEFERALVRRIAKKGDYLRYVQYEMGLEALRKKRAKRFNIAPTPHSISDYALVRRQFYIFERAVRKFKGDVDLWIQYIQLAKKEKARSLVGKISARALQLHPTEAVLYILASAHELDQLSPTAARALLQRGLRLNKDSIRLWTEYAKMELGYIEGLKRRWNALGIKLENGNTSVAKDKESGLLDPEGDTEPTIVVEGEDSNSEAIRDVMNGAIVRTVIRNAVEAIPKVEMFSSLRTMLSSYPTELRSSLLSDLYSQIDTVLPHDPQAVLFAATHALSAASDTPNEGGDIVEALREANERLSNALKSEEIDKTKMGHSYATWVEEWVNKLDEENLRLYLIQSLHALILSLPSHRLSPSLLATDLRLSISPRNPIPPSGKKVTKSSQKYSNLFPDSTEIWLARLQIAGKNADSELIKKTWKEARKLAKGDIEELLQVWLYVVDSHEQTADKIKLYEDILLDSMQHSSASLHPNLLNRYIADLYSGPLSIPRRHSAITRIFQLYLPSSATYAHLFQCESKCSESSLKNLELIFDKWRVAPGEAVNSACQWASWLVQNGKGKEAKDVIERARLGDPGTKQELDVKWMEILQAEQEDTKTHDEDEHHDIDMNDAGIDVFMN